MSVEARSQSFPDEWTPENGISTPSISSGSEEVFFASSKRDSTFAEVKASLEGKDASTKHLRPGDIEERDDEIFIDGTEASEFDGKIFYRPNTWFSDFSEDARLDKMDLMAELETGYDVDFFGQPVSALVSRDKKFTKQIYESAGIGTVDDYGLEEAFERLEEGEEIVAKPRSGTCQGDGVELIESSSELESYVSRYAGEVSEEAVDENILLEEYLPNDSEDKNHDMRMVVLGDEIYRKARVDGDGVANNLDNNGRYVDAPEMSSDEERLAEKTQHLFGEGFYAVDYIRTESGEVKVMENNDTPGSSIDSEISDDLSERIAEEVYHGDGRASILDDEYAEASEVM